jgi:hypothetical protein
MRHFILLGTTVAALVLAGGAGAHRGDHWYDTAVKTGQNIEAKYRGVMQARCFPLRGIDRRLYYADSWVDRSTGARLWDHFACVLYTATGSPCISIAHLSGPEWNQLFLTSYRVRGCSPYQIRG